MSDFLSRFSGILIDFDGTLTNTEDLHQLALDVFFRDKGEIFGKKEPGKSTLQIFRDWGKERADPKLAEKYLREYLEFLPDFFTGNLEKIDWYPDAVDFIASTAERPRVLVTSSFRSWLEVLDRKLGLFALFEHIVTKEDVLPAGEKPEPLSYLLAARKLQFSADECVAVEDSYSGITAAKKAGTFVVAVRRAESKGFEQADKVVNTLTELL